MQRGRAHCVASGEGHSPTLREPCGPALESGWVVSYPDAGYQTWRSRHRHCPETRTRKPSITLSRAPAYLFDQPVSQSARGPEVHCHVPKLNRTSAVPKAGISRAPPEQKPEGFHSVSLARYKTLQNLDPFYFSEEKPSPSTVPPQRRARNGTDRKNEAQALRASDIETLVPKDLRSDRWTNAPERAFVLETASETLQTVNRKNGWFWNCLNASACKKRFAFLTIIYKKAVTHISKNLCTKFLLFHNTSPVYAQHYPQCAQCSIERTPLTTTSSG